jgi:hypothetical protein
MCIRTHLRVVPNGSGRKRVKPEGMAAGKAVIPYRAVVFVDYAVGDPVGCFALGLVLDLIE